MDFYSVTSKAYDILDLTYFRDKGKNPRRVIESMIPDASVKILDLCCGTLTNSISIAEKYPETKIMGLDRSKAMLKEARKKSRQRALTNVYLKCSDACNTNMKDETFDYVIIGLVLHECSQELQANILKEAYRLLKKDGTLIVMEWEVQKKLARKIKFFPLYVAEVVMNHSFDQFYRCNKEVYFKEHQFEMQEQISCNYSSVMRLKKML